MERLGRAHVPHPAVGLLFRPDPRRPGRERLVAPPPRGRHPRAFERRPARGLKLDVRWAEGPEASLDLFGLRELARGRIRFSRRHGTPWAETIRPPVEEIDTRAAALAAIRRLFRRAVRAPAGRGINVARPAPPGPSPLALLTQAGGRLYDLCFPPDLERALPRRGVFLDLGLDEGLLDLPFELMHDRDGFLALKHEPGRFVNRSSAGSIAPRGRVEPALRGPRQVAALVLAASHAPGRAALPETEAEARAVGRMLAGMGVRVTEIVGPAARVETVYEALRRGHEIVHFAGHARRRGARLLLADGALDGDALGRALGAGPPAVVMLNACEAAARGLIDSLLQAGSYVVAAAWPVGDVAARAFAEAFYTALLEGGRPLGSALRLGREAARAAAPPDDLSWAAYLLYGDPKLALIAPRGA